MIIALIHRLSFSEMWVAPPQPPNPPFWRWLHEVGPIEWSYRLHFLRCKLVGGWWLIYCESWLIYG